MALVSIYRLWTSRGGTDTFTRQRTYREVWEAVTDSAADDEEVVAGAGAAALGLPRLGQPHPRFPAAVCVEISAEQSEETPFRWMVNLKYDSSPTLPNSTDPDGGGQSPGDIPENPLLRPAQWKIAGQKTTEPGTQWRVVDAGGNLAAALTPIRNSAKLPFDPSLQIEVSRPVIRVTKNVPFVTLEYLLRLQDAVNDRVWRTLPKWTARVDNYDTSNKFENGVSFVELSVDITLKAETWLAKILDAGFFTLDQRTNLTTGQQEQKWTKIRDPFGHEATEPQPLDGNGRRLAPTDDPVFLRGLPSNYHLENFTALLGL